jgi:hypothetical protein
MWEERMLLKAISSRWAISFVQSLHPAQAR